MQSNGPLQVSSAVTAQKAYVASSQRAAHRLTNALSFNGVLWVFDRASLPSNCLRTAVAALEGCEDRVASRKALLICCSTRTSDMSTSWSCSGICASQVMLACGTSDQTPTSLNCKLARLHDITIRSSLLASSMHCGERGFPSLALFTYTAEHKGGQCDHMQVLPRKMCARANRVKVDLLLKLGLSSHVIRCVI